MSRVLVLNATGKVSAALIDRLVDAGHSVTAASRRPAQSADARVRRVHFDYGDPATFDAALEDVERLFWLGPPLVLDLVSHCGPFLERALPRVAKAVSMTAAGVEHDEAIPLRQIELLMDASPAVTTRLRPSWFHDNFHTFWVHGIRSDGVIALPAGDARTAFIDSRDIADAAFSALTDPGTDGGSYTLTGPESLTYTQAAAILSEAAGRPIRYQPISDEDFTAGVIQAGFPEDYAHFLTGLFQAVRAGAAAAVTDDVQALTGHPPRSLRSYAEERAEAWR